MNQPRASRQQPPRLFVWAILAILAATVGLASGASLTIVHNASEQSSGIYQNMSAIAPWWNPVIFDTANTVPSPAPSVLSTTVGTPTVLAGANTNYLIHTGMPNHNALLWSVNETAAAPASKEVELRFSIALTSGATVSITNYVETQAIPPSSTLVFSLLYDTGTISLVPIVIQSVTATSLLCTAIGTCP